MKVSNLALMLGGAVLATLLYGQTKEITLKGVVTDSMCGAKHMISTRQ